MKEIADQKSPILCSKFVLNLFLFSSFIYLFIYLYYSSQLFLVTKNQEWTVLPSSFFQLSRS